MGKVYNDKTLREFRIGILGIYIEKLKELQNGQVPIGMETYGDMLQEAKKYFPPKIRKDIGKILGIGSAQLEYVYLEREIKLLRVNEPKRKKSISNFLKNMAEYEKSLS